MPKLQTMISDELDKKIKMYSAFLEVSKNDYIRDILLKAVKRDEQKKIPFDIIQAAKKEKEEVRGK